MAFVRKSGKSDWTDGDEAHILLHVFREGIQSGLGLNIDQIFETAYLIWAHVGGEKDYNLTVHALASYVRSHLEIADQAADLAFSTGNYWCFVSEIFPIVYDAAPEKWRARLIEWYDAAQHVEKRRAGLTVFAELDVNRNGDFVDAVYTRTKRAIQEDGISTVGIACYFVCRRWKVHQERGGEFERLLREMLMSMEGIALSNVAFLEHSYVKEATEDEIRSLLKEFSRYNPVQEIHEGVDMYLAEVVKVNDAIVVEFIEGKIDEYPEVVRDKTIYQKTFHELYIKSEELRSQLITRWLLSPRDHMRTAVQKLSSSSPSSDDLRAHVIPDEVQDDPTTRINLIRQSIARLFHSFHCCVSYVISCVSLLTDEETAFVESDFYQMIVMNFPDIVAYESKSGQYDKRTVDFLQNQLDEYDSMKRLVAEVKCPELEPPYDDRLAYAKIVQRRNEEIIAQAKKESIFSLFGPELKILYGNGAIYDRNEGAIGQSRQEMTFNSVRTQVRIPALMKFYEITLQTKLDELSYLKVTFNA